MERPVYQPLGTPLEQLDTPSMVVDLGVMERNIETLHSFFRASPVKARPHVTAHKCPAIARLQLAAGGTVEGIAVSRVGEAEVFAAAGIDDILVSSEIVTRGKINRLCGLARRARISVAVDNPKNVDDLSEGALAAGATLRVLVHVNGGGDGAGAAPGSAAVALAKAVYGAPGIEFAGLMTPESAVMPEETDGIQAVLDTREAVEKEGMTVQTVSTGGVHNYEAAASTDGVTEVPVSAYPLMDYNYCRRLGQFQPAARVIATVISRPLEDYGVADAGHKATGPDRGLPVIDGLPGAQVARLSAEHTRVDLEGEARKSLKVGDTIRLIPRDLAMCMNQYDLLHAVRGGKLEAVWEIAARGRSD